MDELDLLMRMRDEVPLAEPSAEVQRAVLTADPDRGPGRRGRRARGERLPGGG